MPGVGRIRRSNAFSTNTSLYVDHPAADVDQLNWSLVAEVLEAASIYESADR